MHKNPIKKKHKSKTLFPFTLNMYFNKCILKLLFHHLIYSYLIFPTHMINSHCRLGFSIIVNISFCQTNSFKLFQRCRADTATNLYLAKPNHSLVISKPVQQCIGLIVLLDLFAVYVIIKHNII